MNKVGTLVVVVLAVCLLGLPPVLGFVGQSQVEQRVERINSNGFLQIELSDYQRGWFTSTARMEVGLNPSSSYRQALSALNEPSALNLIANRGITVLTEVAHGPVAFADGLRFGFWHLHATPDPEAADNIELQRQLGMQQLFDFRGRAGFTGRLHFDLGISAIDYDNGLATFGSSDFELEGSYRGGRVTATASMDSLVYGVGPVTASLEGIRAEGSDMSWSGGLGLGEFSTTIDRLLVVNDLSPGEAMLEADELVFNGSNRIDERSNLLTGTVDYAFSMARMPGGIEISDGLIHMIVENLDADAARSYYEAARAMSDPADPDQALADIMPIAVRLLEAGPSLSISPVRFAINGEAFDANMRFASDMSNLPPQAAIDLQDTAMWTRVVSADAQLTATKPLAEMIAQRIMMMQLGSSMPPDQAEQMAAAQAGLMLVALSSQGMIVDGGDTYGATIEFANGMLLLNGNPLPTGL